uniref:NADH-ubiquinone oxidoreductase chain 3 n=1 Tax=Taenia solium TaxID=6204 RepID=Q8M6K8_TAESO|nr:NADH dehydrogenase subunit 3 [Taenia solium]QZH79010.1 NADH dehydrogenase subunit 3 [Taenia solium]URN72817.1 NADH dehydrogenase subunit 3 [Taenia solium]BAC00841.1 NADH dehydrogenase subunit 3 [Taenia solium]DBA36350.1 TPA_asm: NADH dehydrogenase subunit 3 [Taenia solium]
MILLVFNIVLFLVLCYLIYFFCSGLLNKIICVDFSWGSSYECGFFSSVLSLNCFSFTYFSLLIIFVIFDLEISLLLNMPIQGLLFYNFSYYYIFLILLLVSFMFELFSGYVSWMY